MEHFPETLTRAQSDALVERLERHFDERGYGLWAVELPGSAPFIGFVGLKFPHLPPPFEPKVEVGWRLAAEHWGHGYATEGARAALRLAFGPLGFSEVVSLTARGNLRSRRVMERLGMSHSEKDDFEHPSLPAGHPLRRHVLYRLARAELLRREAPDLR